MEHIHVQRAGDAEVIREYEATFRAKTNEELIADYEQQRRCGITGVHRQALYLIALRTVMKERFQDSPIEFEGGVVIRFR